MCARIRPLTLYCWIKKLVRKLNYVTDEANIMTVRVANGDKIESNVVCQPLVWRVIGIPVQAKDIDLAGSDMMLGVNWMGQFSLVLFDFVHRCIKFKDKSGEVE